jgi:hypothetical protein
MGGNHCGDAQMPSRNSGAAPRVLMKEMAVKQQGDQQRTSAESGGAPRVSMKKSRHIGAATGVLVKK